MNTQPEKPSSENQDVRNDVYQYSKLVEEAFKLNPKLMLALVKTDIFVLYTFAPPFIRQLLISALGGAIEFYKQMMNTEENP